MKMTGKIGIGARIHPKLDELRRKMKVDYNMDSFTEVDKQIAKMLNELKFKKNKLNMEIKF